MTASYPAPAHANGSVSKTWLIATLTSIVLVGGAGWIAYVQSTMNTVAAEQGKQKDDAAETKRETAVIKSKVERLEVDMKDVRDEQKEQSRKLDELLRRSR